MLLVWLPFILCLIRVVHSISDCSLSDRYSNDTVKISVLLPESDSYYASIGKIKPALVLATKIVSKRDILPGWTMELSYSASNCNESLGLNRAFEGYANGKNLFLGPVCDYVAAPIARMLKFWGVPLITAGALARDFGLSKNEPENEYYMVTRVGLSFNGVSSFLLKLSDGWGWRKLFLLYDPKARPEVSKNDHCTLFTKCVVEDMRALKNFSFLPEKLSSLSGEERNEETFERAKSTLKEKVGTEYAG